MSFNIYKKLFELIYKKLFELISIVYSLTKLCSQLKHTL